MWAKLILKELYDVKVFQAANHTKKQQPYIP